MASNTTTTTANNASLFGDDSDSSSSSPSDESVGRRTATEPDATSNTKDDETATTGKVGTDADRGGDAHDDDDGGEAAPTTATSASKGDEDGDDERSRKEKNAETDVDGGDKDQDKDQDIAEADKGKHASLFGDDDSSDDDEFDGDDGIVGRSAGAATALDSRGPSAVDPAPRTMNQTLGLDSDSDDDHKRAIAAEKQQQTQKEEETPLYRPPRRMELLSLTEEETTRENVFHVAKLPNLVGINPAPYDKRSHDKEAEEEHYRGYVHNMIRWRYRYRRDGDGDDDERELLRDENGNPVRESNARLVKWSDGSYTLHVGTEVLEVDSLDSSVPATAVAPTTGAPGATRPLPGFAGINGYLYVSQKAKIRPPSQRELAKARNGGTLPENEHLPSSSDEDDDEHAAKPAGTILECLGPITSRFAPRPSSLASEAHRNLTLAVRQRNVKRARIAEIVTEVDPEQEKLARIKGKDDLEKSRRGKMGRRSGGGGRRSHGRGMNATYLEEDGDYDGVNLGKLKRQTMRREVYSDEEDADMDYGEDSEEEEDEWSKKKKRRPNKDAARRGVSDGGKRRGRPEWDDEDDDEEEGELVFGDDDDEGDDAAMFKKRGGGGASKKAVLDDDDD